MNPKIKKVVLAGVLNLTISTLGFAAATPGGISMVRGNTNINVSTQDVTTIASHGATARTSIAHVKSSRGNTNVDVSARNVINVVSGSGQKGCINIGVKGGDDCE